MSHVSLSHVTCHLNTTLCSFNCYKSPRRFGNAAAGGLVIDRTQTDRQTTRLLKLFWAAKITKEYITNFFDFTTVSTVTIIS